MTRPTLLLPFEGSLTGQNQQGTVNPTFNNTIQYVQGKVAGTQALDIVSGSSSTRVTVTPATGHVNHSRGAIAARFKPESATVTNISYFIIIGSFSSGPSFSVYQNTDISGALVFNARNNGTIVASTGAGGIPITATQYHDRFFEWDESNLYVYGPSGLVTSVSRSQPPLTSGWSTDRIDLGGLSWTFPSDIDSIMFFGDKLSPSDRDKLMASDVWDWNILGKNIIPIVRAGSKSLGVLKIGN